MNKPGLFLRKPITDAQEAPEEEGRVKFKRHLNGFHLITIGKTRKKALAMVEDLVLEMTKSYFEDEMDKNFFVTVIDYKNVIGVIASDNRLFLALSLRRQREKSGSTVREASERLGSKSPNAYAQYERGRTSISVDKYEELLIAANPFDKLRIRII